MKLCMLRIFRWLVAMFFLLTAIVFASLFRAEWSLKYTDGDGMSWVAVAAAGSISLICFLAVAALLSSEARKLYGLFKL